MFRWMELELEADGQAERQRRSVRDAGTAAAAAAQTLSGYNVAAVMTLDVLVDTKYYIMLYKKAQDTTTY